MEISNYELYTHTQMLDCGIVLTKYTTFWKDENGDGFSKELSKKEYEELLDKMKEESEKRIKEVANEESIEE